MHVESLFFIFVDLVVLSQQTPFVSVLASTLFSPLVVERRLLLVAVAGTSSTSTGANPQALQKCQSEYKVSDTTAGAVAVAVATSLHDEVIGVWYVSISASTTLLCWAAFSWIGRTGKSKSNQVASMVLHCTIMFKYNHQIQKRRMSIISGRPDL